MEPSYVLFINKVKFVGINYGKLGFYTDFTSKDIEHLLVGIVNNEYQLNEYHLLEYLLKSGDIYKTGYGLNEIAVINPVHTQIIDVFLNGEKLETFRGTGFIISTPTGSTAYNKSLGGSIICPAIKAMQLTEVAPINNRVYKSLMSSLVLPSDAIVKLKSDFTYAGITVDGIYEEFKHIEEIIVSLSEHKVRFISQKNTSFWDRVKKSFLE